MSHHHTRLKPILTNKPCELGYMVCLVSLFYIHTYIYTYVQAYDLVPTSTSPPLIHLLTPRKISQAHVCISGTSRAGAELGYDVSIISDGIGDRDIPGASAKQLVDVS